VNKPRIRWRHFLTALTLGLSIITTQTPTASGRPAQVQGQGPDAVKIEQLLRQSGYGYRKLSPGAWIMDGKGKSLLTFSILFASGDGFLVTGVIVAPKDKMNVTSEMMFKLMKLNYSLDYVKIGFDNDDDLFVRWEVKTQTLDLPLFKEVIRRVSDDADQVYGEIKPYLKRA
jgi:hypothetical protein